MQPTRTRLLISIVLFAFVGCSSLLKFHVSGIVRDANTGQPLQGVTVRLDVVVHQPSDPRGDPPPQSAPALPLKTASNGEFAFTLEEVDQYLISVQPLWFIVLSKDGYEGERFEFRPSGDHESTKYVIHASLRTSTRAH